MWGFFTALISGALMSIQGVFNTEVTKQTSLWVSTGMGAALSIYGLRAGMDIYRKTECFGIMAGG